MAKTVVGLYDNFDTAQQVVNDLVGRGIARDSISLVVGDASGEYSSQLDTAASTAGDVEAGAGVGASVGGILGGLGGLLVGLGALAIPGIGPVVAAGPLVSAIVGLGVGAIAGGLVGALAQWGIPEAEAEYYVEGIRRGGTLVAVTALDDRVEEVADIMDHYDPVDLEERTAVWRRSGWTGSQRTPANDREDQEVTYYDPDAGQAGQDSPRDANRATHLPGAAIGTVSSDTATVNYGYDTERNMTSDYGTGVTSYGTGATDMAADEPGEMTPAVNDFPASEATFHQHYAATFAGSGYDYERYLPAYRFGDDLAHHPTGRAPSWAEVEDTARRYWEEAHHGDWDEFQAAIRHGWEQARHPTDF